MLMLTENQIQFNEQLQVGLINVYDWNNVLVDLQLQYFQKSNLIKSTDTVNFHNKTVGLKKNWNSIVDKNTYKMFSFWL